MGHPYAAIKSLEEAIAPAEPFVCIHRRASNSLDFADDRTIRQFSGRITSSVAALDGGSLATTSDSQELESLFDRLAIGPEDHIAFPSACAETTLAILQVLRTRDVVHWPHCHLRFIGDERRRDIEETAHTSLSNFRSRTFKLHLYAEFLGNVRHVLKHYDGNPFDLVRLPTQWPDESAPAGGPSDNRKFTIGVFGQPRRDKGKYRLGPILAEFFAQAQKAGVNIPTQILIQSDRRRLRRIHLTASLYAKLGTNIGRVRFIASNMSNQDFISRMSQCDVVLLPYMPEFYTIRGSGIAIDAVAHGVPLICTSQTVMSELIGSGNGLVASSDRDFAQCLLALAKDRDQFRTGAREAARRANGWRSNSLFVALSGARDA